jgi:hypothetical protein
MTAAALAPAALGEPVRKTELVELNGKSVDTMPVLYDFNSAWLVDHKNIVYRDRHDDYYLVTLKEVCEQLEDRNRRFDFYPSPSWQLLASKAYVVHTRDGPSCDVARIEQLDDGRAKALRDASLRRMW